MRNKVTILLTIVLLGLTVASFASAAFVNCGRSLPPGATSEQIKANECTLPDLIATIMGIINFLLSWSALVAIVFIIWSGWNMIGSGGNEEIVSTAKTGLTNAIIGFFMIMASFVLLNFVVSLLTGNGTLRAGALVDAFNLLNIK
ncbi:MAG: pilin [Candidatus Doudnabacteria bacterium]|nr:pilin [Candidatus Doudnabacteria bacterium]